jgi:phosphatidylglycerophosphate synthase
MLAASWAQGRLTARAQPTLARDARMFAAGLSVATGMATAEAAARHGGRAARRMALPLALATVAQATDIWAHLGLHRCDTAPPYRHYSALGPANMLTAARGWAASWAWARLVAGTPLDDAELALAFALLYTTDSADGSIARRTGLASPLGRYLDAEADISAGLALTLTQIRRGQVPGWFLAAFALRWGAPLALGFARTFAAASPVMLPSSRVARASGAAQALMSLAGLVASCRAGKPDAPAWQRTRDGLALVASALLLATTALHLRWLMASA